MLSPCRRVDPIDSSSQFDRFLLDSWSMIADSILYRRSRRDASASLPGRILCKRTTNMQHRYPCGS